jgi:16S rRNA (cytosine1402-N4)-methyltransferase
MREYTLEVGSHTASRTVCQSKVGPRTASGPHDRQCPAQHSAKMTMSLDHTGVIHTPVLVDECIQALDIRPGGRYIDCTVGTGGHAAAFMDRLSPDGRLLGIDTDPSAARIAEERLKSHGRKAAIVTGNFSNLRSICAEHDFQAVDGILFDLGMSSLQVDDPTRGFSFRFDAPIDMRFDQSQQTTASNIVNTISESELAGILERYGEERRSRLIARRVVANRPVKGTRHLAAIVEQALGTRGRIHPATRTFQALRIAVNQEMSNLAEALQQTSDLLVPGGRLAVISYHSLEDRMVKSFLRQESRGCLCPAYVPVCVCGHTPSMRLVNRKAVTASSAEIKANPRSRSAKLRAAERVQSDETGR